MTKQNALGHSIGESVDVDRVRAITSEYNAALMAHLGAHKPSSLNRWGEVERYGNQGGTYKGHDLSVVYPVLGKTGVSYVEFDTGNVNNEIVHQPAPIEFEYGRAARERDTWWQ